MLKKLVIKYLNIPLKFLLNTTIKLILPLVQTKTQQYILTPKTVFNYYPQFLKQKQYHVAVSPNTDTARKAGRKGFKLFESRSLCQILR